MVSESRLGEYFCTAEEIQVQLMETRNESTVPGSSVQAAAWGREGALLKTHAGILSTALTQIICLKLNVTTCYPCVTPAAEI